MRDERFWREGMDGKRFALCVLRKSWIMAVSAVAGALAAVGIYLLVTVVLAGPSEYQVLSIYRIYFDSEKYGEIEDYYNAYTWGEIMQTDQVVDYVMEALPEEVTKEQVISSVSVGSMSDVKIMPLYVTTTDPGLSETIAEAYVYGLAAFADSIEGLSGMECWDLGEAEVVARGEKVANAALLGLLLGLFVSFLVLCLYYCWEDSLYLEEDYLASYGDYGIPFLGLLVSEDGPGDRGRFGRRNRYVRESFGKEFTENAARLLPQTGELWLVGAADAGQEVSRALGVPPEEDRGTLILRRADWPFQTSQLEQLRASEGVLLVFTWGGHDGRLMTHALLQLEKHQIPVRGALIRGANARFLRVYYSVRATND